MDSVAGKLEKPSSNPINKAEWHGLKANTIGASIDVSGYSEMSIQAEGIFSGGARLGLLGSNDGDNGHLLQDVMDMPIKLQKPGMRQWKGLVELVSPEVIGGDERTDIKVTIKLRK